MEQMAALSFNQSDAGRGIGRQGRGQFQQQAPFTPTGFGRGGQATTTGFKHAEDVDVDADVAAVEALIFLLLDGDPLSQQSQQEEHHNPRAEDIMRHHRQYTSQYTKSRPRRIQTSQKGMRIGMHVIHAVLTYPMDIPAKLAHITCASRITTSISPDRMRSSTSIRGTLAQLRTATRRFSHRCDGQGR